MTRLKKWKLLSEKEISPSPYFPLFVQTLMLPNGRTINDYYISKLGNVAMVVAVTEKKEVVFVRQYKNGVGEILIELPAGRLGQNSKKSLEQLGRDELLEEVGIVAENLIHLGEVLPSPSKDSTHTHGFLLLNAKITQEQSLDQNEEIEIVLVPAKEIEVKIKSGEIRASDTIALLAIAKIKFPQFFD